MAVYGFIKGEGLERVDAVNGSIRVLACGVTLAYPWFGEAASSPLMTSGVLNAVFVFMAYSILLYLLCWRPLVRRDKRLFYFVAAVLDFIFAMYLIYITGGAESPFFRALYLWVAMLAFFFGVRGGGVASIVAVLALVFFDEELGGGLGLWEYLAKVGGILMHGPLIGSLVDANMRRAAAIEEARVEIERKNKELVEEQNLTLRAQKLSSMGVMAAGLAHEINNPLQGALGAIKALESGKLPHARVRSYQNIVSESLYRIQKTVESLLMYARKGVVSAGPVDLVGISMVSRELLAPMLDKKHVKVTVDVPPGLFRVLANGARLTQAVTNVLMNAVQAVSDGGHIRIAMVRDDSRLGVSIADDGPGISAEDADLICDPFFTTKASGQGTGLGLAVTLRVVQDHGGELKIDSNEMGGARVTMWFPTVDGECSDV